jgi:malonyl-CoA reductase/3-hydroxypropionate dehydrogenase (NADP+)
VSSYFGGEKFVAVPYPNRSDYAVSKAGQRALTENLARFCGPEIQINAIAPGPVDGDRLRGVGGKPGLFERRGKLILENRRLNAVWEAVVDSLRAGVPLAELLARLGDNSVAGLRDPAAPEPLRLLAERIVRASASCDDDASCGTSLMTPAIARKLVGRLTQRGALLGDGALAAHAAGSWLAALHAPAEPFFPRADIQREAAKVREGVLGVLHLKRMPSEFDVALATVYYMADRAVSGETFQPSGGLSRSARSPSASCSVARSRSASCACTGRTGVAHRRAPDRAPRAWRASASSRVPGSVALHHTQAGRARCAALSDRPDGGARAQLRRRRRR